MAFLGGIFKNLKEFVSDHREWHALVDGFGIVICPLPLLLCGVRKELVKEIRGELHYFLAGAILGVVAWIALGMKL